MAAAKPVVGIVGLGIMGGAMAEALRAQGYEVTGYDVAPAALERLAGAGGKALASSTAVAESADVVIVSVATSAALADAAEKIAAARRAPGAARLVVLETSTLPIADKEASFVQLTAAGAGVLDCPISGTAVRMKERAWTIFVSGDPADHERVKSVLAVFADNAPYVGAYGNGTKMKFIANHLVAIYNVAYGETMTFARKMGLEAQQVWDLFAASPVIGTGVFKLRGKMMVERRYAPPTMKVEVWQKDMQVIGDMAKSVDCPTPLFNACMPVYTAAMAQGLAHQDTASVCEVFGRAAGVPPA
jgi:3-hydroxyisobutyrate dehydrogenase-like beta-hydroxyacid dehydrogenase